MKRCACFFFLFVSLLFTFASAQESCPAAPRGRTAWFDTCKYLFIASGIVPARPVSINDPDYTDSARRKKINGQVILAVALNAQGAIDQVRVVRSLDPGLDQASIDAVKQWKFEPATKDGKAVPVQFEVDTQFRVY
jgi:TonB family protein